MIGAILEQYVQQHGPLDKINHLVQLTTFGGTGSSALSSYLRSHGVKLPETPGEAPFKHQRVPPAKMDVPAGFKAIYLYSDPRNAMLSIFRRGAIWEHYRGLFGRKPDAATADLISDVSRFLLERSDAFDLLGHVDNWLLAGKGYPVMFLDFEALPEAWDALRSFLELPERVECMPLIERNCAWENLSAESQRAISEIYEPVIARLAELPDVHIVDQDDLDSDRQ